MLFGECYDNGKWSLLPFIQLIIQGGHWRPISINGIFPVNICGYQSMYSVVTVSSCEFVVLPTTEKTALFAEAIAGRKN